MSWPRQIRALNSLAMAIRSVNAAAEEMSGDSPAGGGAPGAGSSGGGRGAFLRSARSEMRETAAAIREVAAAAKESSETMSLALQIELNNIARLKKILDDLQARAKKGDDIAKIILARLKAWVATTKDPSQRYAQGALEDFLRQWAGLSSDDLNKLLSQGLVGL